MASRLGFRRLNGLSWHTRVLPCSPIARPCCYSYSSTASSHVDFDAIKAEMLARPAKYIWDVLSPTNSHLLNIALADFIPPSCQPAHFVKGGVVHPVGRFFELGDIRHGEDQLDELNLPEGHHLVYFPPQIRASDMLPDGTDPFQSPGAPFVRRMWAGGSIDFGHNLTLQSSRSLCVETIDQVAVKGRPGEEKIFVDLLRRYMGNVEARHEFKVLKKGEYPLPKDLRGFSERRTLVFMRRRGPEDLKPGMMQTSAGKDRVVKAPKTADYSVTITPTPMLLFQFSALTYNAHSIHLNPEYCRDVEGHRNLLVHGPLSLTLMLSVLRSQLSEHTRVQSIDYRNLAPLYADEPMRVCVKRGAKSEPDQDTESWDVWVENQDGSLSIRGTALSTGHHRDYCNKTYFASRSELNDPAVDVP